MKRTRIPTWADRNRQADPLGPGSPAWVEFDRAVHLHAIGAYNQYGAARARMRRHLRHAGATTPIINDWIESLEGSCANHITSDLDPV